MVNILIICQSVLFFVYWYYYDKFVGEVLKGKQRLIDNNKAIINNNKILIDKDRQLLNKIYSEIMKIKESHKKIVELINNKEENK